jgi:hypothetical protein
MSGVSTKSATLSPVIKVHIGMGILGLYWASNKALRFVQLLWRIAKKSLRSIHL